MTLYVRELIGVHEDFIHVPASCYILRIKRDFHRVAS